jgi:hypothetical protein
MVATNSTETIVTTYNITRRHNPEDDLQIAHLLQISFVQKATGTGLDAKWLWSEGSNGEQVLPKSVLRYVPFRTNTGHLT